MDQLNKAKNIKILADVNAVPPAGLEGVGLKDDNNERKHLVKKSCVLNNI